MSDSTHEVGWEIAHPGLRLGLSLILGTLGVMLFPFREAFTLDFLPEPSATRGAAWIFATLAATWVIYRKEGQRYPKAQFVLMCATAVSSILALPSADKIGLVDPFTQKPEAPVFVLLLLILLLAAATLRAVSFESLQFSTIARTVTHGLAMAIAAPLLLFASRPLQDENESSLVRRITRAALTALPLVLAVGLVLHFALFVLNLRSARAQVGLPALGWSVWTWLGCAMVTALGPVPKPTPFEPTPRTGKADNAGSWALLLFLILAIAPPIVMFSPASFLSSLPLVLSLLLSPPVLLCITAYLLTAFLVPWPKHFPVPKLADLPKDRSVAPAYTFTLLTVAALAFGTFSYRPLLSILSGSLFRAKYSPFYQGTALDQSTIGECLVFTMYFSVFVLAYVAAAHWMNSKRGWPAYWAFAVPSGVLYLMLFAVLAEPSWWLIREIFSMGPAARRVWGLVYCGALYVCLTVFFAWAIWPRRGSSPAPGA